MAWRPAVEEQCAISPGSISKSLGTMQILDREEMRGEKVRRKQN